MIIKINKNSQIPIYKQIIDQVCQLSENGVLVAGDKLPTEKEFFLEYGIARGTVKRAYDHLVKNGQISVIRGKGAFLLPLQTNTPSIDIIDDYLDHLQDLHLSLDQIELFVAQKLHERGEKQHIVRIAAIDNCPELVEGLLADLSRIPQAEIDGVSLEQALQSSDSLLQTFDLIVGTEPNILLLKEIDGKGRLNLIPVAITFSDDTIKHLATVPPGSAIGVFCRSQRYVQIIQWELININGQLVPRGVFHTDTSAAALKNFLKEKATLLITHGYEQYASIEQQREVRQFELSGGQIIRLEHIVDVGSFMYVEESIRKFRLSNYNVLR